MQQTSKSRDPETWPPSGGSHTVARQAMVARARGAHLRIPLVVPRGTFSFKGLQKPSQHCIDPLSRFNITAVYFAVGLILCLGHPHIFQCILCYV